jgi:transketolase
MQNLTKRKYDYLYKKANSVCQEILDISYHAGVGHIAPALSIVDILTCLYHEILDISPANFRNPDRNRFILSKGHAAAALYVCLHQKGLLSRKELYSFCQNNSLFGVHPDYNPLRGIELTTGSLGHGLSVGIGMALGLKSRQQKSKIKKPKSILTPRVFVLVSDAELNEGSVWEGIMFAGHHKINNLVLIIDDNGNQAFGKTRDVLNLKPLTNKFAGFNWKTISVDGHDLRQLTSSLSPQANQSGKPLAIIAGTHSGYRVSFMKDEIKWHYLPLTEKLYIKAAAEIKSRNQL